MMMWIGLMRSVEAGLLRGFRMERERINDNLRLVLLRGLQNAVASYEIILWTGTYIQTFRFRDALVPLP